MVHHLARLAVPAALLYTAGVLLVLVMPAPHVHLTDQSLLEVERLRQGTLSVKDAVQNVAMFVPVGVLGTAALRRRGVRALAAGALVIVAGALLSLGAEVLQYAVPGRHSSAADVAANVLGVVIGVLTERLLRGRDAR